MKTTEAKVIILTADENKTFERVSDGEILGDIISFDPEFGNVEDYVEIDKLEEE